MSHPAHPAMSCCLPCQARWRPSHRQETDLSGGGSPRTEQNRGRK